MSGIWIFLVTKNLIPCGRPVLMAALVHPLAMTLNAGRDRSDCFVRTFDIPNVDTATAPGVFGSEYEAIGPSCEPVLAGGNILGMCHINDNGRAGHDRIIACSMSVGDTILSGDEMLCERKNSRSRDVLWLCAVSFPVQLSYHAGSNSPRAEWQSGGYACSL